MDFFSLAQCHLGKMGEMAYLEKEILVDFILPAGLPVTYNIHLKILSMEGDGVLERDRDTLPKANVDFVFPEKSHVRTDT